MSLPGKPLIRCYPPKMFPSTGMHGDIDEDYRLKMSKEERLLEWSVVSTGPCLIKIRSRFEIGQNSELLQDMILYSHHRRIDFETRVEWKESHKLLKVSFPPQHPFPNREM